MPVTFGSESREMHASADLHIVPEVIYLNSLTYFLCMYGFESKL